MKKIIVYMLLSFVGLVVTFFIIAPLYEVNSEFEREIIIDRPYRDVLITLANPHALENFVQPSGGQIYDKQWDSFAVNIDQIQFPRPLINSSWKIRAFGHFIVEADVALSHKALLKFVQQVFGDKEQLRIFTALQEPDRIVRDYVTEINLAKDGNKTKAKIRTHMVIRLHMPIFWQDEFQKNVDEINLENQFRIKHLLLDK